MKTTLSIDASKVRELYDAGNGTVKTILKKSFGKNFFKKDITDRVKTYEDALRILGVEDFLTVEIGSTPPFGRLLPPYVTAYIKLCTIIEALNEGWKPNWDDEHERKWSPWFIISSSSSFVLDDSYCDCVSAFAGSGSHLCFKSQKLSDYCGAQFLHLWKEFILK